MDLLLLLKEKKMANKCTELSFIAPVLLDEEADSNFLIEAYTGAVVGRWWGDLAVDVSGMQTKQNIPILLGHDTTQIIGYSEKAYSKNNSFFVSGKFSDITEAAKNAKGLALEGFPWQASVGIRPIKTLSVEKDKNTTVNGMQVNGPAEIWLESEVFETSFVPLGADPETNVSIFEKIKEIEKPKEEKFMEITKEVLKKEAPALLSSIADEAFKKGAEAELLRVKEVLQSGLPGHDILIEKLAFDGKTTGAEAAKQVILAERSLREHAEQNLKDDNIPPITFAPTPIVDKKLEEKDVTEETFIKSQELKAEFDDWETFKAYREAMGAKLVKVISKEGK